MLNPNKFSLRQSYTAGLYVFVGLVGVSVFQGGGFLKGSLTECLLFFVNRFTSPLYSVSVEM